MVKKVELTLEEKQKDWEALEIVAHNNAVKFAKHYMINDTKLGDILSRGKICRTAQLVKGRNFRTGKSRGKLVDYIILAEFFQISIDSFFHESSE